mgnify:CR=1 FL=1
MAVDLVSDIERYRTLLEISESFDDVTFYNKEKIKFNNYNKMFGRFKRDMLE